MEQQVRISFDKLFYTGVPIITVKSDIGELNLLVDSGASLNVLDSQFLDDADAKFDCECKGFGGATSLSEIYELDIVLEGKEVTIQTQFADLSNIRSCFTDLTIHGILGSRFLVSNNAIIDYNDMVLIL